MRISEDHDPFAVHCLTDRTIDKSNRFKRARSRIIPVLGAARLSMTRSMFPFDRVTKPALWLTTMAATATAPGAVNNSNAVRQLFAFGAAFSTKR